MSEQDLEQIFAVIIPTEASLTATIDPSVELSKLFIMAAKKVRQLSKQTREVPGEGDSVTVFDNPDLRWWFDQCRKIGVDIAKLTVQTQIHEQDQKIKLYDMFKNSDILTKKQQELLVTMALENKGKRVMFEDES